MLAAVRVIVSASLSWLLGLPNRNRSLSRFRFDHEGGNARVQKANALGVAAAARALGQEGVEEAEDSP